MTPRWSIEEVEILKKYHNVDGYTREKLLELFPNRTWSAIRHIASHNNLKLIRPKHTEHTKNKMRVSHAMFPNPATRLEVRNKISENNPMKNPETAKEISLIRKEYWRTHPEIRQSYSNRMTGPSNPLWCGGIRRRPKLGTSHWRMIRQSILERDSYHCLYCDNNDLVVHHIIPERLFENKSDADYEENLITVCRKCHCKIERRKTCYQQKQ